MLYSLIILLFTTIFPNEIKNLLPYDDLIFNKECSYKPIILKDIYTQNKKKNIKLISLIEKLANTSYTKYICVKPVGVLNYNPTNIIAASKFSDSISLELNTILEYILEHYNDKLSQEERDLLFEIQKQEQQILLECENLLCRIIQNITHIRATYRILKYLQQEFERKNNCKTILEQDDLDELCLLQELIMQNKKDLIELERKLEESLVDINFIINMENIQNFFFLFKNLFLLLIYYKEHNINLENFFNLQSDDFIQIDTIQLKCILPSKPSSLWNKLIINFNLSLQNIFHDPFNWCINMSLNPTNIILHITNYFYGQKIFELNTQDAIRQWDNFVFNRTQDMKNQQKQQQSHIKILQLLLQLICNDANYNKLKIKKSIKNNTDLIHKEEEVLYSLFSFWVKSNILI